MPRAVASLFFLLAFFSLPTTAETPIPEPEAFSLVDRSAEAARILQRARALEAEHQVMMVKMGETPKTGEILDDRPSLATVRTFRAEHAAELRLVKTADTPQGWLAAAQDFNRKNRHGDTRAAGWKALSLASDTNMKVEALARMADGALGLGAIDEALGLLALASETAPKRSDIAQRRQQVLDRYELRVVDTNMDVEGPSPTACLQFSNLIKYPLPIEAGDYVRVAGLPDVSVRAEGNQICVSGLKFGEAYDITVRAGLPGEDGGRLFKDSRKHVTVPDRTPRVIMGNGTYMLPRIGDETVPMKTVNLDKVMLTLYRVPDRGLVPFFSSGMYGGDLSEGERNRLSDQMGEKVWQGSVEIRNRRNEEVTTLLPVRDMVKTREPGLYALVTEKPKAEDTQERYWLPKETQWLVVSDLGLMTLKAEDGLHVFVNSLESAKPVKGVTLRLVARNNDVLGETRSGRDGRADFGGALLKGQGGNMPSALVAETDNGDFAFLRLDAGALDLSDRGTAGRQAPGALDAFLYTERGVYRPGDIVHIAGLLRDSGAKAVGDLPLTFLVRRPDGVESFKETRTGDALGGYRLDLPLSAAAHTGNWTIGVYADDQFRILGQTDFQVEDFVPERIAASLEITAPAFEPQKPVEARIGADFLYGAPGAGLEGELALTLIEDPAPFKDYDGFSFGLAEESFNPDEPLYEEFTTDAEGKARLELQIDRLPDTTKRLQVLIRANVRDISGRPVTALMRKPLIGRPLELGLKFKDAGQFEEAAKAEAELVALTGTGEPVADQAVTVTWIKEHHSYHWYESGGRWMFRDISFDEKIAEESVTTGTDGLMHLSRDLAWGRYRLMVATPDGKTATSRRFTIGWWMSPTSPDVPDALELKLDQADLRVGGTVRGFAKAPFAGRLLLAVVNNDSLVETKTVALDAEGSRFDLKVGKDWGPGGYILATAIRPDAGGLSRLPVRATGLAWFSVDRSKYDRALTLDVPMVARPLAPVDIPVSVADGKAGEVMKLMIAAVDDGILRLTDYRSPNPGDYYFGQRAFGADLYDIYGRLIRSEAGDRGTIRTGGDARKMAMAEMAAVTGDRVAGDNAVSPVMKTTRAVALFEDNIMLDKDGRAVVRLNLPDFAGRLRLMAVAYGKDTVGEASATLIVRNPVVTDLLLPRFLAPGDKARAVLSVQNLSGTETAIAIGLTPKTGHVALSAESFSLSLKDGERRDLPVDLTGASAGDDGFVLTVANGDTPALERTWDISVRPAWPYESTRRVTPLAPGGEVKFTADNGAYIAGTVSRTLTVSARPEFDAARMMESLHYYAYWCTEQTISRAFPALYHDRLRGYYDLPITADEANEAVERALITLTDRIKSDGSFSYWGGDYLSKPWLDAYATDFLLRAREQGFHVADTTLEMAVNHLKDLARNRRGSGYELAYTYYVLARVGEVSASDVRYFADRFAARIPTRLGKAHIYAALALVGEKAAARNMLADAVKTRRSAYGHYTDFGSELRDGAALATLMLEIAPDAALLADIAEAIEKQIGENRYLNTQEMSWIAQAAARFAGEGGTMGLSVDGEAQETGKGVWSHIVPSAAAGSSYLFRNTGSQPIRLIETVRGVSKTAPEPVSNDLTIERRFFTRDGTPVDPALVKRNTQLVVLVTGSSRTKAARDILIADLLPAGFEIESTDMGGFDFLPDLSYAEHLDARDDRMVAALSLGQGSDWREREFRIAYLVRAVTPGTYILPGAFVEDMYRPDLRALGAAGTVTVEP